MEAVLKKLKKREIRITLIVLIIILCALLGIKWYTGKNTGKKAENPRPVIQVAEAKNESLYKNIHLAGQTVSGASVAIAPKYSGIISNILVELGNRVSPGQLLLSLDTEDLDIAIAEGEASYQAASADAITEQAAYASGYLKAKADYEIHQEHIKRQEYLFSIGAISKEDLEKAQKEYVATQSTYENLTGQDINGVSARVLGKKYLAEKNKYGVQALAKKREDMLLRAPIQGIISYKNAEIGSYVAAGERLFTIVDNSNIYVDCAITERDAALLRPDKELEVWVDSLGRSYAGKLTFVSPALGDKAKTFQARILLTNADELLKAGLFAKADLALLQKEEALCIPKAGLLNKNGEDLIFVFDPEGKKVEKRIVQIGLFNDEQIEILSGLKPGEQVVIWGQDRLQDGMQVDLYQEAEGQV